ncbi:CHAT domain-containing protein [Aquimarina litoralis]
MAEITIFKRCFSLFLFFCYAHLFSQQPSTFFVKIRSAQNATNKEKINQIETLLNDHLKNKDSIQYGLDLTAFSIWLYRNEYYDLGSSQSEKAVKFYKKLTPHNDQFYLYNLNLLARFYSLIDNYIDSNEVYLEVLKNKNPKTDVGEIYSRIANNHNSDANFHIATNYFLKAIEEFRKEKQHRKLFDTSIQLSTNYLDILDDESIVKGIETLKALDRIKDKIDYNIFDEYLINERLGNLYNYETLFDPCASLPYYKKALSIAKKIGNNREICLINNNIGHVYRYVDNDSALFYFKKSLSYHHKDQALSAAVLYSLGLSYMDQEKYDLAYNSLNSSLDKIKIDNKKIDTSQKSTIKLSDKNLGLELIKNLAVVQIKKYESENSVELLDDALFLLKQADELIDQIKLESMHQESKLFWRGLASDIYINLVKVCYLQNNPELAYHYLEKNKALLLLEDLTKERSKIFFNIPDSVIKKERSFKRKIALIKNKSLSETYSDKDRSLELFEIKNRYTSFIDSLQDRFPKYYYSKEEASILSFDKTVDQASRTNTSFVHYILNDELGYILVISEDTQELYEIHDIPLLQNYIASFHKLSSTPFTSKADKQEFQKLARELYKKLLPDTIFHESKSKIIIIPDDSLLSFPFETLMNKEGNYLIEEHEVSYAYSISFLEQNKRLERSPQKEFLGMAPINYKKLPKLPNSAKEVQTIAKKFDSDILMNHTASKEDLINSLPAYKIIHLSTHANANDTIVPWIATTTKNITLNDIYSTKNNAELITLSACNTAKGKLQKGEGVMSIARAFFNTGSNSVVSTLWKADDKSTEKIITNFYTHLKNGASKSEALRNAKLEYLKNHSLSEASPYYWSSLVLIGNPDPMYPSLNTWYILLGILLSFLLLSTLYKIFSKK